MAGSRYKRNRILRLCRLQDDLCYWCYRICLKPEEPGYWKNESRTKVSGRSATLDHLYSRMHPLRNSKGQEPKVVMACDTCNRRRGAVEVSVLSRVGKLEPRIYRPDEPLPARILRFEDSTA